MSLMSAKSVKYSYLPKESTGKVTWRCPSNIALIKYWGKQEQQLPLNPSLSFTLNNSYTETSVEYEYIEDSAAPRIHFISDDIDGYLFEKRVKEFIKSLIIDIPVLQKMNLIIHSKNNFPHSAGIASSASAFGSLALCLCYIENLVTGSLNGSMDFFRKASYISRLGSGSACRSIYGGFVSWGSIEEYPEFSNLFAQPLPFEIHPVFKGTHDTILIVSSKKKKLSSSAGHNLMVKHPYAYGRYEQAKQNYVLLLKSLQNGDMVNFIKIVENEALSLHALLFSSEGGHILLKPESIMIIDKIVNFRMASDIPVCFTIDAGPNLHIIYPLKYKDKVSAFIQSELLIYCENSKYIDDQIGNGPVKL